MIHDIWLEDITNAIELIALVNRLGVESLAEIIEESTGENISQESIDSFEYTGLAPIDFLKTEYWRWSDDRKAN